MTIVEHSGGAFLTGLGMGESRPRRDIERITRMWNVIHTPFDILPHNSIPAPEIPAFVPGFTGM